MYHKILTRSLITLLFLLGCSTQATAIQIGTGPSQGVYFPLGQQLCILYTLPADNHAADPICEAHSTQGSVTNLFQLNAGELDFALVQSDWLHYAFTGTYLFATQGDSAALRGVFSLYNEPFTVIAHQDADIQHFDDLFGKRVIIGELGSGNRATLELLMRAKHQTMRAFLPVTDELAQDRVHALCTHQVDAVIDTIGHPNQWVAQSLAQCPVRWVNVQDDVIDNLVNETPFYEYVQIPQSVYPELENDVNTFGVTAVLVTRAEIDDTQVYDLVAAVFNHFPAWQAQLPELALLTPDAMQQVGQIPIHPGAVQFYQQQ